MSDYEGIKLEATKLYRTTDPYTSAIAAMEAAKASTEVIVAVYKTMIDGVPRIDEEIWSESRARGLIVCSEVAVRVARLALSRVHILVPTGRTKLTKNGCKSNIWVFYGETTH